jgi:hypothetical protein
VCGDKIPVKFIIKACIAFKLEAHLRIENNIDVEEVQRAYM